MLWLCGLYSRTFWKLRLTMGCIHRSKSNSIAFELERSQIVTEIRQCDWRVITLKRRLNTLAPISTIPSELICEIFLCYTHADRQGDCGDGFLTRNRHNIHRNAVRLSHVCYHWRNVALSSPQLWAHMTWVKHMEWTKELLCRTQQAPLFVHFVGEFNKPMANLELILKEIHRIQTLHIDIHATDSQGLQIYKLINRDAPLLRSLALELRGLRPPSYRTLKSLGLSRSFPQLTELSLGMYLLETTVRVFQPPLRTLQIRFLKEVSATLLCTVLGGISSLQSMDLQNLRFSDAQVGQDHPSIELKCLQDIRINGSPSTISYILGQMKATTSLSLHLSCIYNTSEDTNWSLFFSNLLSPRLFKQTEDSFSEPFDVLRARFEAESIILEGWRGTLKHIDLEDPFAQPDGTKTTFQIYLPRISQHFVAALWDFGKIINSMELKALFLESHIDSAEAIHAFWTPAAPYMPALQGLWLADCDRSDLPDTILPECSRLGDVPSDEEDEDRETLGQNPRYSLPQLRSLHIKSVKFKVIPYSGPHSFEDAIATLLRLCRGRRKEGVPLQRLSIFKGLNIGPKEIRSLGRAVVDVVWDGSEEYRYGYSEGFDFDSYEGDGMWDSEGDIYDYDDDFDGHIPGQYSPPGW